MKESSRPSKNLINEIKYDRISNYYWYNGKKIRMWLYKKISKYYGKKHEKEILSR